MEELKPAALPLEFIQMLKMNIQPGSSDLRKLENQIQHDVHFKNYLAKRFVEFKTNDDYSIIKILGWEGFRNRLSKDYLSKACKGNNLEDKSKDYLDEILSFEKDFSSLSITGSSYLFLLGFYLRMQLILDGKSDEKIIKIPETLRAFLNKNSKRSDRPDIVFLLCLHIFNNVSSHKIETEYESLNLNFEYVYSRINQKQKEKLHSNLLAYNFSINEIGLYEQVRV